LKLPFFVVCSIFFGVMVVEGIAVVVNASLLALSVVVLIVILSGGNPWWLRSPLDRRVSAKKGDGEGER
jgi:hypothetical protein